MYEKSSELENDHMNLNTLAASLATNQRFSLPASICHAIKLLMWIYEVKKFQLEKSFETVLHEFTLYVFDASLTCHIPRQLIQNATFEYKI